MTKFPIVRYCTAILVVAGAIICSVIGAKARMMAGTSCDTPSDLKTFYADMMESPDNMPMAVFVDDEQKKGVKCHSEVSDVEPSDPVGSFTRSDGKVVNIIPLSGTNGVVYTWSLSDDRGA